MRAPHNQVQNYQIHFAAGKLLLSQLKLIEVDKSKKRWPSEHNNC